MRKVVPVLLLVLAVFLFRMPSLIEPHWYDDEEIYLTIGQVLHQGGRLYMDVVDNKPPLLYWWTAIIPTLLWMKVSASLFVAGATIGIYLFTKQLKYSLPARLVALTVFLFITNLPAFEGNIFNAELMFLPFSIFGFYLWQTKETTLIKQIVIGLIFGVGSLVKVPVLADLGALLTFILLFGQQPFRVRIKSVLVTGLAATIPWILTSLWFALHHAQNAFWYYSLIYNFKYVNDWQHVTKAPLLVFLSPFPVRIGLLLGGILVLVAQKNKFRHQAVFLILLWLIFSWFGSLLSIRPYPHYYLQLAPSLALLAGWFIMATKYWERIIVILPLIMFVLFIKLTPIQTYKTIDYYQNWMQYLIGAIDNETYKQWFRPSAVEHERIAQYIHSRALPGDRLFVWGNAAAIYTQSGLAPATPYVTDYLIRSFNTFAKVETTLAAEAPRFVAVCNNDRGSFPKLFSQLITDYVKIQEFTTCSLHLKTGVKMLQ